MTKICVLFILMISHTVQTQIELKGLWEFLPSELDSAICVEKGIFQNEPDTLPKLMSEEGPIIFEKPTHIYFGDDSIYYMNYPCTTPSWGQPSQYSFSSDSVYIDNRTISRSYSIQEKILTMSSVKGCIIEKAKQVSFSSRIVLDLQRYGISTHCLIGKYKLHTQFTPEYPFYKERYELIPPVKMPLTLDFRKSINMHSMLKNNSIYIKIEGENKRFNLQIIRLGNFDQECESLFEITPGKWWTGESFNVQYRAYNERLD